MSALDIDVSGQTVSFELPASVYSEDSLRIAAHIFDNRAEVSAGADAKSIDITLKSKRKADAAKLRDLGGEFLNELLNQEYRALVSAFNHKVTNLVATQALFSARGGQTPPEKADETAADFKADVAKMLAEAQEEIKRTMPKKIASKGIPMTLPKKEAGA